MGNKDSDGTELLVPAPPRMEQMRLLVLVTPPIGTGSDDKRDGLLRMMAGAAVVQVGGAAYLLLLSPDAKAGTTAATILLDIAQGVP